MSVTIHHNRILVKHGRDGSAAQAHAIIRDLRSAVRETLRYATRVAVLQDMDPLHAVDESYIRPFAALMLEWKRREQRAAGEVVHIAYARRTLARLAARDAANLAGVQIHVFEGPEEAHAFARSVQANPAARGRRSELAVRGGAARATVR